MKKSLTAAAVLVMSTAALAGASYASTTSDATTAAAAEAALASWLGHYQPTAAWSAKALEAAHVVFRATGVGTYSDDVGSFVIPANDKSFKTATTCNGQ